MSEGVTKASSGEFEFINPSFPLSSEDKYSSEQRKRACNDSARDAKRHCPGYNSIVVPR